MFGVAGVVWSIWWEKLMASIAEEDPAIAAKMVNPDHGAESGMAAAAAGEPVPWRAFLRNRPVQALAFTHFTNNWCGPAVLRCVPIHSHACFAAGRRRTFVGSTLG